MPCGIDRAGGEPGAILFRSKASDRARGEHSGNERSGGNTIAIPRNGIVNTPSSTQETNTAADWSAVVGSGSVPRHWRSDPLLERPNPLQGRLIGFGLPAFLTIVTGGAYSSGTPALRKPLT